MHHPKDRLVIVLTLALAMAGDIAANATSKESRRSARELRDALLKYSGGSCMTEARRQRKSARCS
jgi:hypothetical protein